MPGGNSDVVPPDSIPNSEVKHVSVDGSVGLPHVRVEHRQAPNSKKKGYPKGWPFFVSGVQKNVNKVISIIWIALYLRKALACHTYVDPTIEGHIHYALRTASFGDTSL